MTTPTRSPYPTDVTDAEWTLWEKHLPAHATEPNFPEPKYPVREILNAILYKARTGCQWRNLPHDFPPWDSVYYHYAKWRRRGCLERARDALREATRQQAGRHPVPSVAIVDAQSVKGTAMTEDSGYDGGKKVKGRKRHLMVDVLGLVLVVWVSGAEVGDREGFRQVTAEAQERYSRLQQIDVDQGYQGELIRDFEKKTGIRVNVSSPPPGQKGFVPVVRRWVIERTFGWLGFWRSLSKSYHRLPKSEEFEINLAMCQIMVRRLVHVSA
jgi:putative transposase